MLIGDSDLPPPHQEVSRSHVNKCKVLGTVNYAGMFLRAMYVGQSQDLETADE